MSTMYNLHYLQDPLSACWSQSIKFKRSTLIHLGLNMTKLVFWGTLHPNLCWPQKLSQKPTNKAGAPINCLVMASRCDHFGCKVVWGSAGCESPQIPPVVPGRWTSDSRMIRGLFCLSESWSELLKKLPGPPFSWFLAMSSAVYTKRKWGGEFYGIFLIWKTWFLPAALVPKMLQPRHLPTVTFAKPMSVSLMWPSLTWILQLCCQVKNKPGNEWHLMSSLIRQGLWNSMPEIWAVYIYKEFFHIFLVHSAAGLSIKLSG